MVERCLSPFFNDFSTKTRSAVLPQATEQPADADRNQDGSQRSLPDELLADARGAVGFFLPLGTECRGFLAHLLDFLLGSVPYGPAHSLQIFRHFFRLLAKLFTCGRHGSSSLVKKHEIARRKAASDERLCRALSAVQPVVPWLARVVSGDSVRPVTAVYIAKNKKSRRGGTPEVFDRVGLLANEPPGTAELLST